MNNLFVESSKSATPKKDAGPMNLTTAESVKQGVAVPEGTITYNEANLKRRLASRHLVYFLSRNYCLSLCVADGLCPS